MSMYTATVPQLRRMLGNLDSWLDKAVAFAETKKFDADTLLVARLAPDQFPLGRQIQGACDHAKFIAARLSGETAPAHPDVEKTIPELKARIASVQAFLDTITAESFHGAADRTISLAFAPGMVISGADYLNQMGLPNFYFHITTAYAILRHNGVDLGKRDFIGAANLRPAN